VTATETLTSLLASFFAEPSADGLAVLADGADEVGLFYEARQLRALRIVRDNGYKLATDGAAFTHGFRTEEEAWEDSVSLVRETLTVHCEGCKRCRGCGWHVRAESRGLTFQRSWDEAMENAGMVRKGRGWVLKGA
jgi:hypothetical protein